MRVRGDVSYDGSPFHGFAANDGVPTVAGLLNDGLSRVLQVKVTVSCAGRTDRGVHAAGQVISFDLPDNLTVDWRSDSGEVTGRLESIRHSLNRQVGPSVVVTSLAVADDDFDARFSAIGRTYRYRILDRPDSDPFITSRAWHVPEALDLEAMEPAAAYLVGEHDFSSFCRRPSPISDGSKVSLVRRVTSASFRRVVDGLSCVELLEFEVSATAFCHQMVRSIVGTLVAVGRGRIPASAIPNVLAACDRQVAGEPAPPQGLTFWSVEYA